MTGIDRGVGSRASVRTQCGRQIVIGRLLVGARGLIGRVVLRINCTRAERDQVWASLTPAEARLLAGYLLAQAEAIERGTGHRPAQSHPRPTGTARRTRRSGFLRR